MISPPSASYRFASPREERIYRRLRLLGPGPAAFYLDACRLMAGEVQLATCTHLVGHTLREIDSGLREALDVLKRPLAQVSEEWPPEGEGHANDIRAVLKALDISEDAPIAVFWLSLTGRRNENGLAARAHHRALATPRVRDEEFERFWDSMNALLDTVLERFEARYGSVFNTLDTLLSISDPQPYHAKQLRGHIPNSEVALRYFFDRLDSPKWLKSLAAAGYFTDPPACQYEGRYVSFPYWPESQYLARVAESAPRSALEIALRIPVNENCRVHEDIVSVALAMPAELSADLVPTLIQCLNEPYQLLLPELAGKLVVHLCRRGFVDKGIELARETLAVLPDPRLNSAEGLPQYAHLEPRGRMDDWEYGEVLATIRDPLVVAAGLPVLDMLCCLLERAVRLSLREPAKDGPYDISFIWRPEVESDAEHSRGLRDYLVSAVRDAAEKLIADHGTAVLTAVESRPYRIFQRIGLHLRRLHPDVDPTGTAALVQDRSIIDDTHLWHELYWLLHDLFGGMPHDAQKGFLAIVRDGPERNAADAEEGTEGDGGRASRVWQYRRLLPVEAFLAREPLEQLQAFRREIGDLSPLTDRHYALHAGWVGPTSPMATDELAAMSADALVRFAQTWEPSADDMAPSPEGLSRQLQMVVKNRPAEYARQALLWIGTDPTYVRGILAGFEEALKAGESFEWDTVLDLCEWVLDQYREDPDTDVQDLDHDPGWGWTRKAIAGLLNRGLEERPGAIGYYLRTQVWNLLRILSEDPDPTFQYEARYGPPNMAPHMLAINSVRGQAMHAVIQYAIWVCSHIEEAPKATRTPSWLSELPEVQAVLELHLDTERDPSLAVHSVYGQWLPTLLALDREWLNSRLGDIFPAEIGLHDFRRAAWDAFVLFSRPSEDLLNVLGKQYAIAVDELSAKDNDNQRMHLPDERMADHLMLYMWHGSIDAQDTNGLIHRFFSRASDELRGHAIGSLGDWLQDYEGALPEQLATSLRSLWEERVQSAYGTSPPSHVREFQAFGGWFASGKFPASWSLHHLQQILANTTDLEHDNDLVERLAVLAYEHPLPCAQCMVALLLGDSQWRLHAWRDYPKEILAAAVRHHDPATREQGQYLVNRLLAANLLQFQSLLSGTDDLDTSAGGESS